MKSHSAAGSGQFINFNGALLDSATPVISASNRSFRYGDGLFETMRWENGEIRLGAFHFDRFFGGLKILQMECPADFTSGFLSAEIAELCRKNKRQRARVRLNVYREESAALYPENNRPRFVIECSDLPEAGLKSLRATIYSAEKKPAGILSNLKTNNYLLNVMAVKFARQNGFDDALILNSGDRLCEAGSSNLFFIKERSIYTPSLAEGCVAGVMRRHLLNHLPQLGFSVH
ncbi:MAG TPA: aminotransferase class IV, partial [Puia sp.]